MLLACCQHAINIIKKKAWRQKTLNSWIWEPQIDGFMEVHGFMGSWVHWFMTWVHGFMVHGFIRWWVHGFMGPVTRNACTIHKSQNLISLHCIHVLIYLLIHSFVLSCIHSLHLLILFSLIHLFRWFITFIVLSHSLFYHFFTYFIIQLHNCHCVL